MPINHYTQIDRQFSTSVSKKEDKIVREEKEIVKEYCIEYECYKTGECEEVLYATQKGKAITEYDTDGKKVKQYIEWAEIEDEYYELNCDWRFCDYNMDYFAKQDEDRVNVKEDIKDVKIDEDTDDEILNSFRWSK